MSSLVGTLTASGGHESAGFLNDIVAQLWPNINVAAAQIAKDTIDPILAASLPGPLSSIHFTKLDLGTVPMRFSKVDVHKTTNQGIKLDMDLDWEGKCDIELDGNHVPKIGIEQVHLKGRLSILLCPLTNIIPLIGAAQIAFINPPTLDLDFTDAASIADVGLIKNTVRSTILGIIAGMAVLPNRFLVKLDVNNDWFKTYQSHHGILRLTIGKASGIAAHKKGGVRGLLNRVVKDVPDCYVKVNVGSEPEWRTDVLKNKHDPEWNVTRDFLVMDYEQAIVLDVQDDDLAGDDDIGLAYTTVKDILLNGGAQELPLMHQGQKTAATLTVHAQFYNLVSGEAPKAQNASQGKDEICGLVTVLVEGAKGLDTKQRPEDLSPSVKVTWGDKTFVTAVLAYAPGTDIFNPRFDQAFKIPLTADMVARPAETFRIALLNKTQQTGSVEVAFRDVLQAKGMVKAESFDVRASISVQGIQLAK
ncbi:hypothetical protein C8J57DRAFT_1435722 [Mycena rebaudengoi]|nr:hypothetical protein C8J57DRAFT_1435722 [Mycena rebaudengoi]